MVKEDTEKQILICLLALSAVERLSTEDQKHLSQLLAKYPDFSRDEFEETAALSQIGFYLTDHTAHEKLPSELRNRILEAYENSTSSEKNNLALSIFSLLLKTFIKPTYFHNSKHQKEDYRAKRPYFSLSFSICLIG